MPGNILQTVLIQPEACPYSDNAEGFCEYLADESRMAAESVELVFFPEKDAHVADALRQLAAENKSCVVSGGRTGITAAASPIEADAVVSLERMNCILAVGADQDDCYVRLEPGVSLQALEEFLSSGRFTALPGATEEEEYQSQQFSAQKAKLWFPVNPTETSAHLGGVIANNASGARTYRYGCAREWVRALTVVLPTGQQLKLRRGDVVAAGSSAREFVLDSSGQPPVTFNAPLLQYPKTKCTCGYFSADGMDAVDLFIGSEGTLGIITEIELRLITKPEQTCGIITFCADEAVAITLVDRLRKSAQCDAIEYFDRNSLSMICGSRPGSFNLTDWDTYAVYCELSGTSDQINRQAGNVLQAITECGISAEMTWATDEVRGLREQKDFRHSIPEAVNALIGRRKKEFPELHKVGTDMAVPFDKFKQMLHNYRQGLTTSGLDSVIFGHVGDGHVHVNILPENPHELLKAKKLYASWAQQAVGLGGTVAAEHGVGRLKKDMLATQYSGILLEQMRSLRAVFDPKCVLGRGVLI